MFYHYVSILDSIKLFVKILCCIKNVIPIKLLSSIYYKTKMQKFVVNGVSVKLLLDE